MGQQVPVQVVLPAKALLTARAMEGFLPGVGQPVSHEVVPSAEALPTFGAQVALRHWEGRLLFPGRRALSDLLALVGLAFCVHSLVAGQMGVTSKILAALRTPAWLVM